MKLFLAGCLLITIASAQTREERLGAKLAAQIRQEAHPLDSPTVSQYLTTLGNALAGPTRSLTYTVVLDDVGGKARHPLIIPGGYLFIPARLIVDSHDEAQFAGTLAHSIAHILDGHLTRSAAGTVINYGTIPLVFVGGWNGFDGVGTGGPLSYQKYLHDCELEADRDGASLLATTHPNLDGPAFIAMQREVAAVLNEANPPRRPPSLKLPGEK